MKPIYKKLGSMIKSARRAHGHTQKELALHLGFGSSMFVSTMESGRVTIPFNALGKIIKLYKLNRDAVVEELLKIHKDKIDHEM